MQIKELSIEEFTNFAENHPMHNYCQTMDYAILMGELGYDYELIGYGDDKLLAASLILTKKIGYACFYGYAPKGFLIDYSNEILLKNFTEDLSDYFEKKDFAFIKINPEIAIGEIDLKENKTNFNNNYNIIKSLEDNNYKRLKNNYKFESLLPRFTGLIPLKDFNDTKLAKNTRNKIKKGLRKGLKLELGSIDKINILENLVKDKEDFYYNNLYNIYHKNNKADLFLVYIDPETYLINAQNAYVDESDKNSFYNNKIVTNPKDKNINHKMNSDKTLLVYKNEITEASKMLNSNEKIYIAAALTIKDHNRVHIIASGFDDKYKSFVPNYFLYYALINYYQDDFNYLDLNGLSGDFSRESDYYGLNKFKLGFKPKVYEFIGELDLIIDQETYNILLKDKFLAKEFNKN